jgi:CIC family chloride channel protein
VFMIGGSLGALEGNLLPHVFPGFWAMAGLAAVVGGVMRSPLTGIVFTMELTHAWNDLMPLLVASVSAYLLSVLLLKRSVLTEKIARRGLHLTREYSTDPLEVFFAREVMTVDPVALSEADLLDDVLRERARVSRTPNPQPALYPVVDENGLLTGILTRRELLACAAAAPNRLIGVVDLTQLLHARRQDQYEENYRQRHLGTARRTDPAVPATQTPRRRETVPSEGI